MRHDIPSPSCHSVGMYRPWATRPFLSFSKASSSDVAKATTGYVRLACVSHSSMRGRVPVFRFVRFFVVTETACVARARLLRHNGLSLCWLKTLALTWCEWKPCLPVPRKLPRNRWSIWKEPLDTGNTGALSLKNTVDNRFLAIETMTRLSLVTQ